MTGPVSTTWRRLAVPPAAIKIAVLILALSAGQAAAESSGGSHGGGGGGAAAAAPPVNRVATCANTRGQGTATIFCAQSLWRPPGNPRRPGNEGGIAAPLARMLYLLPPGTAPSSGGH